MTRSPATSPTTRALTHARWIALGPALAITCTLTLSSLAACAGHGSGAATDGERGDQSDSDIFGGVKDDDAPAKRSVVALRIGADALCSGALIAPNLVLTARHCVARTTSDSIACNEQGLASNKQVLGDEALSKIAIYVGASPSFTPTADAYAKTIVSPAGDALCNSDLAVIVLDRSLANIVPLAVRFDAPPRMGETFRAVGYGQNDAKAVNGIRFRKDNVPVLAVGGAGEGTTKIGPREFEVGKSVCDGDSGGPAISELTGAVIGVVSRGGACGADSGHIYTTTAGFDALFDQAFAAAGSPRIAETNTPPATAAPVAGPSAVASPSTSPSTSGCRTTPSSSFPTWLVGLVAFVALRRRR